MAGDNLYSMLEESFAAADGRTAIRSPSGDFKLSYAELKRSVCRYANALEALNVRPGDRVTALVEKSVTNVLLYLAALKAGAVYQPLNPAYTDSEVEYFVADAEPTLLVCDAARMNGLKNLAKRYNAATVIPLEGGTGDSLADLADRMGEHHGTMARETHDLAGLLYTSGTTGPSKGAMITHGNLCSNAQTLVKLWAIGSTDVLLHALPIFHVHGLYVALNTAFVSGSEIIWFDKFDASTMARALPTATMMMGVPTFYTRLLAAPDFTREACRKMRLFVSGSAPLPAEIHWSFHAGTGHAILERYGMTETGMITSNPLDGERVPGTVGYALPGVSIRIAGEQPGVIEVKGPNVFRGYWRNAEKTTEAFTEDGFFITGDLATMDEDGRLRLVGRAKDLIITGGLNVYPGEVEATLDEMAGIAESAVFGVPHPDLGEGVVAAVMAEPAVSETEIIRALASRLAKYKLPKRIFMLDALPRNAMGKVLKEELRRRYATAFAKNQPAAIDFAVSSD